MTVAVEQSVVVNEIACADGMVLGRLTLNAPKRLNALSFEMLQTLYQQLVQWQGDPRVACVILDGAGERGFCAGGDVRQMTSALNKGDSRVAERFFTAEYRLDHLIHRYAKPLLVWGNGVLMGGGVGLFAGASHRVVTESTVYAMPELSIGLYPDIGASFFLNQLPELLGRFIGLTGARLNGSDLLALRMADHFVLDAHREQLFEQLTEIAWSGETSRDSFMLSRTLLPYKQAALIDQSLHIESLWQGLSSLCHQPSLAAFLAQLAQMKASDPWLEQAWQNTQTASPLSLMLIWQQLERCRGLSLEQCFQLELGLSVNMVLHGDFREGVRARLEAKTESEKIPQWRFSELGTIPQQAIDELLASPWGQGAHPLSDLTTAN